MTDLLNQLGLTQYVPWVLLAEFIFRGLSMALPPPTSAGTYNWVYVFVNALALNFLNAKNSSATEVPGPSAVVASGPVQAQVTADGGSVTVGGGKK